MEKEKKRAVPLGDEEKLLDAARFMDDNECDYVIPAGRETAGKSLEEIEQALLLAGDGFGRAARKQYSGKGEW